MIFSEEPPSFLPRFEIVSCFFENNGQILLLHRQDHKMEGSTWGVPAGKRKDGETLEGALRREVEEETGYTIQPSEREYFRGVYIRYPTYDFLYHMYRASLKKRPQIVINPNEHKSFRWVSPREALKENLIQDLDVCIKLFYKL